MAGTTRGRIPLTKDSMLETMSHAAQSLPSIPLQPMLNEFNEEAAVTRRVLDHVPADKLSWKPHAKSMTLGQLAMHIALVPGSIIFVTREDAFDISQINFAPPQPSSPDEIGAALDKTILDVTQALTSASDEVVNKHWRLMLGSNQILSRPRAEVWRSIMLNHWYHHRGQLTVYLRLLDVPVPSVYGPSADDNPFS
jgi:uncharacterized damage-inducible protein DinB